MQKITTNLSKYFAKISPFGCKKRKRSLFAIHLAWTNKQPRYVLVFALATLALFPRFHLFQRTNEICEMRTVHNVWLWLEAILFAIIPYVLPLISSRMLTSFVKIRARFFLVVSTFGFFPDYYYFCLVNIKRTNNCSQIRQRHFAEIAAISEFRPLFYVYAIGFFLLIFSHLSWPPLYHRILFICAVRWFVQIFTPYWYGSQYLVFFLIWWDNVFFLVAPSCFFYFHRIVETTICHMQTVEHFFHFSFAFTKNSRVCLCCCCCYCNGKAYGTRAQTQKNADEPARCALK